MNWGVAPWTLGKVLEHANIKTACNVKGNFALSAQCSRLLALLYKRFLTCPGMWI